MALDLPEAYEDLHRRRPAFRVNKKIFAMLGVAGETSLFPDLADGRMAVLKLDRDDQLNMAAAHEDAVTPTGDYSHHGWTYVRLADLDEAALAMLVRLAWAHVAPKRLVR
jgi:hypothetical protein